MTGRGRGTASLLRSRAVVAGPPWPRSWRAHPAGGCPRSATGQPDPAQELGVERDDDGRQAHEDGADGGRQGDAGPGEARRRRAGWRRRCTRPPRPGSAPSCGSWPGTAGSPSATPRGSLEASTTPADSIATSVPAPMAMPTSARASAGASLTPSPTIATVSPRPCSSATVAVLVLGQDLGEDLVDAELGADGRRRPDRASPVIITTRRRPASLQLGDGLGAPRAGPRPPAPAPRRPRRPRTR